MGVAGGGAGAERRIEQLAGIEFQLEQPSGLKSVVFQGDAAGPAGRSGRQRRDIAANQ